MSYRRLFAIIAEKTGWTPSQIANLTWNQLNLLIDGWTADSKPSYRPEQSFDNIDDFSDEQENPKSFERRGPTVDELKIFNITAGIERVARKKSPPPPPQQN